MLKELASDFAIDSKTNKSISFSINPVLKVLSFNPQLTQNIVETLPPFILALICFHNCVFMLTFSNLLFSVTQCFDVLFELGHPILWSYSIFHWIKLYLVEPLWAKFKQDTESLAYTDKTFTNAKRTNVQQISTRSLKLFFSFFLSSYWD